LPGLRTDVFTGTGDYGPVPVVRIGGEFFNQPVSGIGGAWVG
jgi:hypothetical protein